MKLSILAILILLPSLALAEATHKPGRSLAVVSAVQEEESVEQSLGTLPQSEQFSSKVTSGARIWAKGPDVLSPHSEASCSTTKDLRPQLGDNRNQSGTDWCFAFTAADMLTQKLGTRVSAAAVASLYYQQKENRKMQAENGGPTGWSALKGGFVIDAIADAEQSGSVCSEAEFHSDQLDVEYRRQHPKDYSAKSMNEQEAAKLSHILSKLDASEGHFNEADLTCDAAMSSRLIFPGLDIPSLLAVLRKAKDSQEAILWMEKLNCRNPLSIPKSIPKAMEEIAEEGHGRKLIPSIDQQLERGQLVGLTYSLPSLLTETASSTMKAQTVHSSSIVQRKFFDGQCRYLIRDSLGKRCEGYRLCDSDPGNFWVTADDLDKAGLSIQYFP